MNWWKRPRFTLICCCLMTALAHLALILVPRMPGPTSPRRPVHVFCDEKSSFLRLNENKLLLDTCIGQKKDTRCHINCTVQSFLSVCFESRVKMQCNAQSFDSSFLFLSIDIKASDHLLDKDYRIEDAVLHQNSNPTGTVSPEVFVNHSLDSVSNNGDSSLQMTCWSAHRRQVMLQMNCEFYCDIATCHRDKHPDWNLQMSFSSPFWIFFSIFVLAQVFHISSKLLMDAIGCEALGIDKFIEWGSHIVWGTFAFGLNGMISATVLYALVGADVSTKFTTSNWLFSAFIALSIGPAFLIKTPNDFLISGGVKTFSILMTTPRVLTFLFATLILGAISGCTFVLLFWYLIDFNDGTPYPVKILIFGLSILVSRFSELPFLIYFRKIVNRLKIHHFFYIALAAQAVRCFCYAYITLVWVMLPVEMFHGLADGLMFPAAISHANRIVPRELSSTLERLCHLVYIGVGPALGVILGGLVFHLLGGSALYLGLSMCSLVTLLIIIILNKWVLDRCTPDRAGDRMEVYTPPSTETSLSDGPDIYEDETANQPSWNRGEIALI